MDDHLPIPLMIGIVVISPFLLYLAFRLIFAAYYRSKEDHLLNLIRRSYHGFGQKDGK